MKNFDYSELDDGIREVVRGLHKKGWITSDSGDGIPSEKKDGMDGVIPFPHIVIAASRDTFFYDASCVMHDINSIDLDREWFVEATYSPNDDTYTIFCSAQERIK